MAEPWRLTYLPQLDGVRGAACVAVIFAHAGTSGFALGGLIGVEMFFVLSGFLITALLLDETAADGRVDLARFYRRRAVRLFPALAAFLVVVGVAAAAVGSTATVTGVGYSTFYAANIARTLSIDLGAVNHLWSLAVEEHFYLIWPLAVLALARHGARTIGLLALLGFASSYLWRFHLALEGASWDRLYNGTDTRAGAILLGCWLATVAHRRTLPRITTPVAVLAAAFLAWSIAGGLLGVETFIVALPLVDIATALLIAGVATGATVPGLATRPAVWLGQHSYGLYLWHVPIMMLVGELEELTPASTVAAVAASLVVAWASMRYIERPARARWAHRRPVSSNALA